MSHATARLKSERGPVRREDAPGPPRGEAEDAVEAPAVAGRREGQREAGQHDEHDDREPPVDEPAGPERCVVDGVAGERAHEDVVHDHVERRQAADAVQAASEPPPVGGPSERAARGSARGRGRSAVTLPGAERAEEAVAEGAHRPDRRRAAWGACPSPSPSRRSGFSTAGSWAMIEIGTSWSALYPVTMSPAGGRPAR